MGGGESACHGEAALRQAKLKDGIEKTNQEYVAQMLNQS